MRADRAPSAAPGRGVVGSRAVSDLVAQPPDSRRASDADRDRVLAVLAAATSDGRLTIEEHHELMVRTLESRTMGELATITQDLEPVGSHEMPSGIEARRGRSVLAIFGSRSKKGVWAVPNEETATAVFGAVELDYREAAFPAREVTLTANSFFGSVELTVPEWVDVVDDGHVIFGAREQHGSGATSTDGRPRVRLVLNGLTVFGSVEVRRKPPKPPRRASISEGS